ncbi:MAG: succinate dehydrogenase, hydrophobic membrane anchor protein [Thiotrichaceae bacterium]|nr:succinate dehydrogenase, hydrophobic membrane anchor protein [Thiotrichaceae bacterium]
MVIRMALGAMQTTLAKVKGLGSAHNGTEHFWWQRVSALALIPLVLWLCFSLASLGSSDYNSVKNWFDSIFNAITASLFVVVSLYHGQLGMQMVIEDYISQTSHRLILLIALKLGTVFACCFAVFAIIKLWTI